MLAWDVAAVVGLLFPEPTTSALGAARLARHLRHFGKAKGLARGLKGMSVGATGLKRGGYQAIKGGAKHTGSRGILSGIGDPVSCEFANKCAGEVIRTLGCRLYKEQLLHLL